MAVVQAASVLGSFPFRAAVVALCVLLLPLIPSPRAPAAGEGDGDGGGRQALLAKVWELLHLLFVGIAVSYGLFSRRNDAGGRVGVGEKDAAAAGKADARYVSRMLQGDLVFDDDGDDRVPDSPHGGGARSWSALHHPEEPVVMVASGGGGRNHAAQQAPMSLPVRSLKQQDSGAAGYGNGEARARPRAQETVLPSPIPWRSRSGRFDARTNSPSPSPKRLSPASSMSNETLAKASEEQAAVPKRRSTHKSYISSPPPPPPPPPPFLVHGYHPVAERRTTAAKSFKEELQDHSTRGRGDRDHYSQSFSDSSTYTNSSPANPRSSFDGSSSSSSSPSVGKSVRTIRPREGIQPQIQELPDEDEAGDAPDNSHGSEEPYGYNAYQSIPRFQYERGSSDPILGKVAVSSDETESSDDDEGGVGAYSTRTNSPRESPPTPEVDENEVDKKAEEFIAKFRESIRLQRIESIKKSAGPRGVKHGK
ncbi:serine/arginine repetitive matrix protein 1-like [Lolium rigidum]|uniref:serine/arginine repetitive matrix protein 1-like n=1 Tax=Lolium rigidum TaxID=89674 RepID=UPI001F5C26F9|nr:serine/arginine repetitive matrix protein 1-like [Lolium rigidum]